MCCNSVVEEHLMVFKYMPGHGVYVRFQCNVYCWVCTCKLSLAGLLISAASNSQPVNSLPDKAASGVCYFTLPHNLCTQKTESVLYNVCTSQQ